MVQLKHRGWDVPGGHLEPGETPEEALRREALEEGNARGGACSLLGVALVDQRANPLWRPGGRYPQVGYQAYFRLEVSELLPFTGGFESAGREFIPPKDVPLRHQEWNSVLQAALDVAAGSMS